MFGMTHIFEALKTLINILEADSLTGVCMGFFGISSCLPPTPSLRFVLSICYGLSVELQAPWSKDCHYPHVSVSWLPHAA